MCTWAWAFRLPALEGCFLLAWACASWAFRCTITCLSRTYTGQTQFHSSAHTMHMHADVRLGCQLIKTVFLCPVPEPDVQSLHHIQTDTCLAYHSGLHRSSRFVHDLCRLLAMCRHNGHTPQTMAMSIASQNNLVMQADTCTKQ